MNAKPSTPLALLGSGPQHNNSVMPASEPAATLACTNRSIVLVYASVIVACPLAVTLLSLQAVFQQVALARQAWLLVGLQVIGMTR